MKMAIAPAALKDMDNNVVVRSSGEKAAPEAREV